MPTLTGYETNSRTIDFPISKENNRYPARAGTYTYVVTFTKDGYSKSCEFTVTVTPTYTVTFDANGGTMKDGSASAASVAEGEKVPEPSTPTRGNDFFAGWYLGDTDKKWDFENDTVTENITLTAKWLARDYTVTAVGLYGGAMGINPGETFIRKYAESEGVGLQIGKRDGYTLKSLTLEGITESDLDWQAKEYEVTTRGIFFRMPTNDVKITVNWVKNGSSSGGGGGSGSTTYPVAVAAGTDHGSVTVSPRNAARGAAVTVTVTPDKGYTLETLTVLDKDGKELTLTRKSDTQYTFTMPAGKVEVKASFMDDNTMLNFFTDVKADDYFHDAVLWAAQKGITSGTDAVHFSPNQPCTRAQIVTFLWRAADSPVVDYAMAMQDVPADAYYAEAVRWALSEGITTGTSDTTFSPGAVCTRAQAVTFLCRSRKAAAEGGMAVREFTDFDSIPAYAADAIQWALENHVTAGTGDGSFAPNDSCTRAQIVTFLYRAEQGQ